MEVESFAPATPMAKLSSSDLQQHHQAVFSHRSIVSVTVSHRFHFSRSEIFMSNFSLCPPFLMFLEEGNGEKESPEEQLTPGYHSSCCTILPVLSWHMST